MNDVYKIEENNTELNTISMTELYDIAYAPRTPVIEDFLYSGTYLFVGAPKVGKSFFMAQLSYHVATGLPLWGNQVHQSTVLYLALEDTHARLQRRLNCMYGIDCTEKLHISIKADGLNRGLIPQLNDFIKKYPDTRLIIIDTLQKIRPHNSENCSYILDYENVTTLKDFSDKHDICLLLVHHTRKMESNDSFDMISGTNGLLGAADGAFILQKKKRTECEATLEVTGRDQQDMRYQLSFEPDRHIWNLVKTETDLWKEPSDPVNRAIMNAVDLFLSPPRTEWRGTATELLTQLSELNQFELAPNSFVKRLNVSNSDLKNEYNIQYENRHCHERKIILKRIPT